MHRSPWLLLLLACCCESAASWTDFVSQEGRFRAEFPGRPTSTTRHAMEPVSPTDVHVYLVERGASGSTQLTYYDLHAPSAPPALLAEVECATVFDAGPFRRTAHHAFSVADHAGLAVEGVAPISSGLPSGGWSEHRCIAIGSRMFHLVAVGPNEGKARATGRQFLESFRTTG